MRAHLFLLTIIFVAVLVIGSTTTVAQISGGSIVGLILDASGGVVAGVNVSATNLGTNQKAQTVTNEEGYYEFPLLPAGRYVLEAEITGFKRGRSAEFRLNSGTRPRIDLTLAVGEVTDSVEVVSSAPLVNVTTTDLGTVVDNRKIEALPLNGRNYLQLVGLQAGVIVAPASALGGRGGIEFHGSPATGNNLLLDGVDMSFGESNAPAGDIGAGSGGRGSLITTVSVEAIQEFKATGSAFSAEYGRATGGVLNVTTKSGTNQFHGTLFEFFRNDALDANSFFSNRSGLKKPPLRWNQYGGNLGGPILKDQLFFFFNYEGATVRRTAQIVGNVATPLLRAQLTPALRESIKGMPETFEPTSNPLVGLHRRNDARKSDEHTTLSRADLLLGRHQLSGRYSYNHQDFSIPIIRLGDPLLFPNRFHNVGIQDSFAISPTMFNESRFGFSRSDLDRRDATFQKPFGNPGWYESAAGLNNGGSQGQIHSRTSSYTVADNFTLIRGNHTLKSGFEIRALRSSRIGESGVQHFYDTLSDLIADRSNGVQVVWGGPQELVTTNYGLFVQDDWRVNQRLQLNLGLRYEYYTPLTGAYNIKGSDPLGPFAPTNKEGMFAPDRNNFGPRLGLVFDTMGNQKLVVRVGGGINYVPPQPILYYDMGFNDPRVPFYAVLSPVDVPPDISLAYPFPEGPFKTRVLANPALLPAGLALGRNVADYNRRDEYSGQWNLSIQHAATSTLALQASYVGSRALKIHTSHPSNLVLPSTGQRPRPELGDVSFLENSARSIYHALQLSANQRLVHGLTFDGYYTWSKNLSYHGLDANLPTGSQQEQDMNNVAASYGPKVGDTRHRFVSVFSYALPAFNSTGARKAILGDWTFQGIMGRRSGLPINVRAGRDLVGNQLSGGHRPDRVPGVDPYVKGGDPLLFLNTSAFDISAPLAQRRFGNLGYNAFNGPAGFTFDAALHKAFVVQERHRITFRFEAFNVLNHKVLANPQNNFSSATFGRVTASSEGRSIQLGLKYMF